MQEKRESGVLMCQAEDVRNISLTTSKEREVSMVVDPLPPLNV